MKGGPYRTRSFLLAGHFITGVTNRVSEETTHNSAPTQVGDDRLIRESGTEGQVAAIILPTMESLGFKLVRVHLSGVNGYTLQIMAERADGTMSVEDCEILSKAISPVLDADDPITRAYHLEVSSPGIERQLVRKSDFLRWHGYSMKLETNVMIGGKRRFKGKLAESDDTGFTFVNDTAAYGEDPTFRVSYDTISDARLIMTEELIREALKRDKALREAQGDTVIDDDTVEDETGGDA